MKDKKPKIGAAAEDGWIYAGISPDTRKPMYAAPADAGVMTLDDAMLETKKLQAQGKADARIPSKGELKKMFNARAKIAGFDETGRVQEGWYFSSSPHRNYLADAYIKVRRFSDGKSDFGYRGDRLSVRLVRS
ncbi:MAG: DUF1566 domain-containing protein [Alphaproteobacteria bacterium]|nr:hypothetical protein [Alphaproteobacteria bacterium]MDE2337493.1 DUF1566 domain-containing protein [Alphaproteobacteria bacterium]